MKPYEVDMKSAHFSLAYYFHIDYKKTPLTGKFSAKKP